MAINLSDKLTADHSENYIMSIRLRSGGLSFSAYSPSVSESFFYRDVEFDRTRPYVSSLKECFFENDFLTWFYKQVNVVCVTSQYTLVPAAVFQEKQKAELLAFTFSSPEGRCLSNELKDEPAELVFGVEDRRMCMSSVPVRLSILVLSIMSVRCFRCGRSRAVRACPASYMSCCIGGGWMWRAMRRETCFL